MSENNEPPQAGTPGPQNNQGGGQANRFNFPQIQGASIQRGASPFPAGLQKALDDARKSGNFYVIVCNAADESADCEIQIYSERSAGFHRGNLVRAWQKAGMQILDFDPAVFESTIHKLMPQIVGMVKSELQKQECGDDPSKPGGNSASSIDESTGG